MDTLVASALGHLEKLVGFDTVSSKSNLPLIDYVEASLSSLGVSSTRVPNAEGDKAALFATIGSPTDGGLVLSGHTDVVPVEGQKWSSDPFVLRNEGGKLYGRGTCDMKGFDAICLALVPELLKTKLAKPVHLLFSYDEEIGCLGSLDTIARFGVDFPRPAAALVGEPTMMNVVPAHKGIATYRTTVWGKEAHSADPRLGTSAIEAASKLINELGRFQSQLAREGDPTGSFDPPYSTVHVGVIKGGNARNILARRCTLEWEFRSLPGVEQDRALRFLEGVIDDILPDMRRFAPEASIETEADHAVPPLFAEPGCAFEEIVSKLSGSRPATTASYVTEAGQFQKNGIPTVVCGPGSIRQAHQPDEFLEIEQLEASLAFMLRLRDEVARW